MSESEDRGSRIEDAKILSAPSSILHPAASLPDPAPSSILHPPSSRSPPRVFITAAEVSGDQHAAQLVASLHKLRPNLVIEGIGGPRMRDAGCVIHHETVTRAAMGLHGAKRYFEIKRILGWTEAHFTKSRPSLQIGVDSPDMNIHFAKLAKRLAVPVLQYVAPQTWAWREYRIGKFRRWVDHIACILPFEENYFRERGVPATFVGHPLFDELPTHRRKSNETRNFADHPPTVGLMPGSRASEAHANFLPMLAVGEKILRAFPGTRFLTATTDATHDYVTRTTADFRASRPGFDLTIERDAFDTLVPQCDLVVVASGTATLHVAGFYVPMVVVYRGNWLVWNLLARWLAKTSTFSLVNLLAENRRHIVPEHMPWFGQPEPVAALAIDLLRDPARLQAQSDELAALVWKLDRPGASDKTAQLALSLLR